MGDEHYHHVVFDLIDILEHLNALYVPQVDLTATIRLSVGKEAQTSRCTFRGD